MKVAILGSTGSIGCNTLKVIKFLSPRFEIAALSAGYNVELLASQITEFNPTLVSVADEIAAEKLYKLLSDRTVEIQIGLEGMNRVASTPNVEIVVSAVVGARGLLPTLKAIELGRRVCIANKEPLVMAGELMMTMAAKSQSIILPIDSEHNALHQCIRGEEKQNIKRLILTASGGPFRQKSIEEFQNITIEEALQHPTWQMGRKITIDSATLMNKGLEVVEAHWLFGVSPAQIDVIVHPQSVVHSMVEMMDGSVIAQLGVTNMQHPIQYALTYPERIISELPSLDLIKIGKLEFEAADIKKFPCLRLAYNALNLGGTAPAVLNAANEEAVNAFLERKIPFTSIPKLIEEVLESHTNQPANDIEAILHADQWARIESSKQIPSSTI